jgi:hypothetical protein
MKKVGLAVLAVGTGFAGLKMAESYNDKKAQNASFGALLPRMIATIWLCIITIALLGVNITL